jgi:drug/metabolite transporter (DMT)-like permease
MLLGSLSFALMATLAHALRSCCDWQVIVLARSMLPLVLVTALALGSDTKLVFWRPRTLWVRSIAGSLSMVGTFFALTRLPVSDVFTLTNMFPIWVAVLSWPLLGEAPSGSVWLSVASGIVGVILIQQPSLAEGNYAALIALGCSLCTAVAMLGLHQLQGIDAKAIVVHFSGVALLFCTAAFFAFKRTGTLGSALTLPNGLMLLGIGVTATAGQLFLTKAFAAGPPAKVSVVALSQIVFALVLEIALFGRTIHPLTLLGMALVVGPSAWLLGRGGREPPPAA